jgi:hypothetical protein
MKTVHCKTVHCKTVHCKTVHCKTVYCKTVHCKTVHCKTVHSKTVHCKTGSLTMFITVVKTSCNIFLYNWNFPQDFNRLFKMRILGGWFSLVVFLSCGILSLLLMKTVYYKTSYLTMFITVVKTSCNNFIL